MASFVMTELHRAHRGTSFLVVHVPQLHRRGKRRSSDPVSHESDGVKCSITKCASDTLKERFSQTCPALVVFSIFDGF